jgi:hypothetical protein
MTTMLRISTFAALTLALIQPARAQQAQTTDQAVRQGFKVVAMIVTDTDWREKWNTPRQNTPRFHGPGVMKPGDKATVLTFFSNARLRDGAAVLHCDVVVRNPDGTGTKHPPQLCFQGPLAGGADSLYMAGFEIGFEVSADDLSGLHAFEIGVTDVHRGVRVPVEVTVEFATEQGAT